MSGTRYFLTFCTQGRKTGLQRDVIANALTEEAEAMQKQGVWILHCSTVMPDHMHLLITLSSVLPLGRCVARLKARSAAALRATDMAWQEGYHDHRLRLQEELLPYFLYVYLNPFRARLLAPGAQWPWFSCGEGDRTWFLPMLSQNIPEPEWLRDLP